MSIQGTPQHCAGVVQRCILLLLTRKQLEANAEALMSIVFQFKAVTTVHVCDFVVWTPNECTIETVTFDEMF